MSYSKTYISHQIAVYKTGKALLEFTDKMNPASANSYAHIHAGSWEEAEDNKYSLIGLLMKDYSKGTGDKAITVSCNILPEEAQYYLSNVEAKVAEFSDSQTKIFGEAEVPGYSMVTKLFIYRQPKNQQGEKLNYPWTIIIENGIGIPQKNANGGTSIKEGTYKCQKKVRVSLTDKDLFIRLKQVDSFIQVWEMTYGIPSLKEAKSMLADRAANK